MVNFYILCVKLNSSPPRTCFLSLDWCNLFIQLCLDISKDKSWILQSRFHCFLHKLSRTIAQGRRVSHAPPCKIQNPPRFFANHAHKRQHFSTAQPCTLWIPQGAKQPQRPGLPSPELAGISLVSACYSSTDSRVERGETRSIHDSLAHVVMIPEGRSKRYGSNTNPG